MYNKVKLTKRQIKEDKFTTFMLNSKQYATSNWQVVVIAVAALILVVFGLSYMNTSSQESKSEAALRFSQALLEYRNGNNTAAISGLNDIVDNYGGDKVAQQSMFLLGRLQYDLRNYPESQRYYEMYASKYKNDKTFLAAALGGLASCSENLGNYAEAGDKFAKAFNAFPDGPLAGDYSSAAMRNYLEAGDFVKAKEYLDVVEESFAGSNLVARSKRIYMEKTINR